MGDLIGFTKRIRGPNRINWSDADIERLRQIYGLTEKQAAEIVQQQRLVRGELFAGQQGRNRGLADQVAFHGKRWEGR